MRPTRRAALIAAMGFAALPGAARAQRTIFERLAFDDPRAAVNAFLDAWRAQDFVTVFWILAPATQRAIAESIHRFDLVPIVGQLPDPSRMMEMLELALPSIDSWEHDSETSWLFDRIMMVGRRFGASPFSAPAGDASGSDIVVTAPGPSRSASVSVGALQFRLTTSPAGHWRVAGAFGPNADPTALPWGIRR